MTSPEEIYDLEDLRPGDVGFGPIHGRVGTAIKMALAIADGGSPYQHVYMITEAAKRVGPDNRLVGPWAVEAMPGGAVRADISQRWTVEHCYVRPDYVNEAQAHAAVSMAITLIGTPYSYLDYLALALHHVDPVWKVSPKSCASQRLARYIRETNHMICSQLVDFCLTEAGWHPFNDKRLPQDVVPSALYNAFVQHSPRLTMAFPLPL